MYNLRVGRDGTQEPVHAEVISLVAYQSVPLAHVLQSADVQSAVEENGGAVYIVDIDITFIFIAQMDKSMMVKCKLLPGQLYLYC